MLNITEDANLFDTTLPLTNHASRRAAQRAIPISVVKLILEYGDSKNAGNGARKYALSKTSMKNLRRDLGASKSASLDKFRSTYVVSSDDAVITVAFATRPIFH